MSKLYERYLELKSNDKEKIYLFRSGKFYIFLAEDCDYINEYIVLKKTPFCKDVLKCGFPDNSLDEYMRVFKNHNLNIELVDNDSNNSILQDIRALDLHKVTPIEALLFLESIQKKI